MREPAHRVSDKAIRWWTINAAIGWVFPVLAAVVPALVLGAGGLWWSANAALVVLAVAHTLVMPRWRYRVHRWETTDDAVYTRVGWLSREWRVAPMSRIQTVDTQRGPLQQVLKLATVTVTTASAAGPVQIAGLDADRAAALVEQLTATTQATPGDAT